MISSEALNQSKKATRRLTDEENMDYILRIREGDQEAKVEFIRAYKKLIKFALKNTDGFEMTYDELFNEGIIAFIEAIDRFDPSRNCKFSTYAVKCIKEKVKREVENKSRVIRISIYLFAIMKNINIAYERLVQKLRRRPTLEELSKESNVPKKKIMEIMTAARIPLSLDKSYHDDETPFLSCIEDKESIDAETHCYLKEKHGYVEKALSLLTDKERQVIELRYGLKDNQARRFNELGTILNNVSRQAVDQTEKRALKKLKDSLMSKITVTSNLCSYGGKRDYSKYVQEDDDAETLFHKLIKYIPNVNERKIRIFLVNRGAFNGIPRSPESLCDDFNCSLEEIKGAILYANIMIGSNEIAKYIYFKMLGKHDLFAQKDAKVKKIIVRPSMVKAVAKPKKGKIKLDKKHALEELFIEAKEPFKSTVMKRIMDEELFEEEAIIARFIRNGYKSEKAKSFKDIASKLEIDPQKVIDAVTRCLSFYIEEISGIIPDYDDDYSPLIKALRNGKIESKAS